MHCRRHMNRGISVQLQAVYRLLVRKIYGTFSYRRKSAPSVYPPGWMLYFSPTGLSAPVEEALTEQITLLRYTGWPIRVLPLTERIPSDCIGILERTDGERSIFRMYLKPREVCVVKTQILWLTPHEITEQAVSAQVQDLS